MKRSLGFSLIEVLASIVVISIVVAVVVPVVRFARTRVESTECVSNLRQIGVAGLLWSGENEGRIVPVFYPRDNRDPFAPSHWPSLLAPYLGYQLPLTRVESAAVFVCPSRPIRFGYGYNYTYLSWVQLPDVERWAKYDEVRSPAQTVMMSDSGEYANSESGNWRPFIRTPNGMKDYVVDFRHDAGRFANVLWLDGHVSAEQRNSDFFNSDKLWKTE